MVEATKAWTKIPLKEFTNEKVRSCTKHMIVHDQQGNLPVLFQYQHCLFEFHKKKIQVTLGSLTKEKLLDEMRHTIIHCLGEGKTIGIMVGNLDPNFTTDIKDDKVFPSSLIFDKARFTDTTKQEYMTLVKEDENWSLGKLNKG